MVMLHSLMRTLLLIFLLSAAYYSVVLRPRMVRRAKPLLRSMLDLEKSAVVAVPAKVVLPRVCVLAPVTSRGQAWMTVVDTCLVRILLPSLERTCEEGVFEYVAYVGYDTSDVFFNRKEMLGAIEALLAASFKRFSVRLLGFDNPKQKPGPVMNGLSKAAYDDGCEYLYRVNDDSELVSPWTSKFVATLQGFKPPLVGVVGPTCREGNTNILIQDFVHRKHHEIFGRHYPPVLTDWWLDDWISLVYGEGRTVKHPDVLAVHRMDATRYTVTKENEHRLHAEVEADKKVLERYLRGNVSAATSGKLFQMRRQQRHRLEEQVYVRGSLKATEYPVGRKWAVITTIFEPTVLIKGLANAKGWCTVVVGDKKSLSEDDYLAKLGVVPECFVYLTVEKQLALDYAIVPLIGMNTFGRKNIGYIFAMHHGAERIYDTDDDNEIHDMGLLEKWADRRLVDQWLVTGSNPYPAFGVVNIWPRGLPLDHIKDQDSYAATAVEANYHKAEQICVVQSLANEEPDVDAIYRLTNPNYPVNFDKVQRASYVRDGSMAPFNAQATLFMENGFSLMLLPSTVHGRVSDIWRSYLAQAVGRECRLVFSSPWVTQKRNAHNYLADFESEMPLYLQSTALVEFLVRQAYPGLRAAMHDMYDHGVVGAEDVRLAQAWELDVQRAMVMPRSKHVEPQFRHLFISMGRLPQLQKWIQIILADARVGHVDMLMGSFDQPMECKDPRVECHSVAGTSWTTGRNALVKLAYHREKRLGFKYDYWTVSDADTVIVCRTVPGAALVDVPSCFADYDNYLQRVRSPIVALHAVPMINTNQDPGNAMGEQASFDAAWNTFHRDAIPVLMPYYADLDGITWWSSQAIFWYRVQCFEPVFASAPLSMFYHNPDHGPYPRNPRTFDAERVVGVTHLYELANQIPLAPLDYPEQIRNEKIRSIETMGSEGDWRERGSLFRKCEAAFNDTFLKFIEAP